MIDLPADDELIRDAYAVAASHLLPFPPWENAWPVSEAREVRDHQRVQLDELAPPTWEPA